MREALAAAAKLKDDVGVVQSGLQSIYLLLWVSTRFIFFYLPSLIELAFVMGCQVLVQINRSLEACLAFTHLLLARLPFLCCQLAFFLSVSLPMQRTAYFSWWL